jgi:hypothetical protein
MRIIALSVNPETSSAHFLLSTAPQNKDPDQLIFLSVESAPSTAIYFRFSILSGTQSLTQLVTLVNQKTNSGHEEITTNLKVHKACID